MPRNRTRSAIGSKRTSALWKIVAAVVLLSTAIAAVPVIGTIALLYFAVMILMELLLDRSPKGNGVIVGMLRGIPMWYLKLWKYAFLGREFPGFVPSRA